MDSAIAAFVTIDHLSDIFPCKIKTSNRYSTTDHFNSDKIYEVQLTLAISRIKLMIFSACLILMVPLRNQR